MNIQTVEMDAVIIGGGIAGLWTANSLHKLGYQTLLVENQALGHGQTICSQGIIHGGLKYALTGKLSSSANAIESMPQRWQAALQGEGDLDLRNVHVLSDHQLLWSTGQLSSNISSFFASKLLRSRIRKLDPSHFPTLLQNPKFKGHVYRLSEIVLDPASLLKTLADPIQKCLLKTHTPEYQVIHDPNNPQNIVELQLPYPDQHLIIKAKRFVLTAGQGNQSLSSEPMQKRPLHMVVMKAKNLSPLYAHCIGSGSTPRMTITTHTTQDGSYVWYLGGDLAESGTQRTQEEQVAFAKKEVQTLFPWFDTQDIEWFSFFIDRAEPKQKDGKRPETAFIEQKGNVITAWPTKLALSPILSDSVVEQLQRDNIQPSTKSSEEILTKLPKPSVAKPMWEASSTE